MDEQPRKFNWKDWTLLTLGTAALISGWFTCNPHGCNKPKEPVVEQPKPVPPKPTNTNVPVPKVQLARVQLPSIDCSGDNDFVGTAGEYTYRVKLGTKIGKVAYRFFADTIPDQLTIFYDGVKVVDTGFIGDERLNNMLTSARYPSVKDSCCVTDYFEKKSEYPTEVIVKVTAPFPKTYFNLTIACPITSEEEAELRRQRDEQLETYRQTHPDTGSVETSYQRPPEKSLEERMNEEAEMSRSVR